MADDSWTDLYQAERQFTQRMAFPPRSGLELGARWAGTWIRMGTMDSDRSDKYGQRITAKVKMIRELHAKDSLTVTHQTLACLFAAADDEAISRYFLARVTEPAILDITCFKDAAAFAEQNPWLDAERAEVIGCYKIFTQFEHNGQVVDGSYTGEASTQTVADRAQEHAACFASAAAADLAMQWQDERLLYTATERLLYNATTLPVRYTFLATTCHMPKSGLSAIWTYTTLVPLPIPDSDLHLATMSLDEMILCAEFEDLRPFPGVTALVQSERLARHFHGLNTQYPGVRALDDASRLAVRRALRTRSQDMEREANSIDGSRIALARPLMADGLPVVWHGSSARLAINGEEFGLMCTANIGVPEGTTGPGMVRLISTCNYHSNNNGSPLATSPWASQLLDEFRVVVTSPKHPEGICPSFSGLDLGGDDEWRKTLTMLHWVAGRLTMLPEITMPIRPAKDEKLAEVAVRVRSKGGCGLRIVAELAEGDQHTIRKVSIPRWEEIETTRYFGAVESCEQDIGQWWILPAELQPPGPTFTTLVIHTRGAKPDKLAFVWEDANKTGAVHSRQWRNLPGPLTPEHRFFVNIVRWDYGLSRIGRKVGRGAPKRINKAGQHFGLSDLS
ncbi:unnamed protein product [Jaminaea pallidilutea]